MILHFLTSQTHIMTPTHHPAIVPRTAGRSMFLSLGRLLLVLACGFGRVSAFDKLPNGDGSYVMTTVGTFRKVVEDWIGGSPSICSYTHSDCAVNKRTVQEKYGEIEEWDVSEVTRMDYIFFCPSYSCTGFKNFNSDLSKWNTSAVTTMEQSKFSLGLL